MSKQLISAIRKRDIFGHQISLNLDDQGDSHQTVVGGIFSIFLKILMGLYIIVNFVKMIEHGDDKINEERYSLDLE